jgi:hypothetical protein
MKINALYTLTNGVYTNGLKFSTKIAKNSHFASTFYILNLTRGVFPGFKELYKYTEK